MAIIQQKANAAFTIGLITLDVAVTPGNLLVAVVTDRGAIAPTPAVGGWTLLASSIATAAADGGIAQNRQRVWARAATDGTQAWSISGTAIRWRLYELSDATIADAVVLTQDEYAPGGTSGTLDLGDFTSATGVAVMAMGETRGNTGANHNGAGHFSEPAGWTERYDDMVDPSQVFNDHFVLIADASPSGATLDASATYTDDDAGQFIGRWGGVAVFFPATPALVCGFSADPTSGFDPLSVEFTDETTGSPDTWLWDFGDGDTSTEQNPTHIYAPGTYDVTLTASRGGDEPDDCTLTIESLIHVTAANAWDIYAADDLTGPPIATFENAKGRWIRSELHGLGEGGLTINRHAAEATEDNLAEGNMVKVRIRECGPDYIDGFFLGADGDYTLLAAQGGQGKEDLTFRGPGALSYLDRARMTPCAFSIDPTVTGTWTKVWMTKNVNQPVGAAFDSAMSGYVFVGGLGSRKVKKLDQSTRAVVATSAALWPGDRAMGGISFDPDDDTIMWVLEAPWLLGSSANTKIRKYSRGANGLPTTLLDTYDLGSAVQLTDIRVDGDYVWTSRYDNDRIQQRDKSDPTSVTHSSTITYKGKVQHKPNGIAINGTKVAYWFGGTAGGGTGRALIADTSAYTTITGLQNTTNVSAFGGEWTTEGGEDFLYAVSYVVGKTWKYQLTNSEPACADDSGVFHPAQVAPGALAWRVLVEITHPDRPTQPCPELSFDFTEDEDSDGTPWPARTATEEFTWRVGDRAYSEVLARLIPAGVTFDFDVNSMTLHAYVDANFGADRTSATFATGKVRFAEAVNLAVNGDLGRRDNRGQPDTDLTVLGDGRVYGQANLTGRYVREGFMQVSGPTTEAVLDAIGDDELARQRLVADSLGFETLWAVETSDDSFTDLELVGRYVPKRHYWKGDLVRVDMTAGEFAYNETDLRVYGTLITERDGKQTEPSGTVEPGWRSALDLGSAYKVPPPIDSVPGDSNSTGSAGGGGASGGTTLITSIPLTVSDDADVNIPRVTKIIADGVTSPAPGVAVIPTGATVDAPLLEELLTDETDTTLVPHPDGTGGVGWGQDTGDMVPYYIDTGETFTVPEFKQALFSMLIDNLGTLDVQGFLLEVD